MPILQVSTGYCLSLTCLRALASSGQLLPAARPAAPASRPAAVAAALAAGPAEQAAGPIWPGAVPHARAGHSNQRAV